MCIQKKSMVMIIRDYNDNKRLQTFDIVTTYLYGTNAFKVCESQFLRNSLKKGVNAE